MNVQAEIDRLKQDIKDRAKKIKWLLKNQPKLEQLPEGQFVGSTLMDFDNLPHADVVKVVRVLGGKWTKTPGAATGTIDYASEFDGLRVRCWKGEAPPSCRIIEVEEHVPAVTIPATTRMVKKMVCQPDFIAQVAMAAERHVADPATPAS